MKRLIKIATGTLIAVSALMSTSILAQGDVSYNIGFASEYYYRGILQKDSSASAGIDYENSGFYAGAWTADVGDGVEVDGYFGYGMETDSGFSASLGFTGYYYTGEFDDTYEEINLNLGYKMVSLAYSVGEWDGFGAEQDYDFLAVTVESESGFYGTYGTFGMISTVITSKLVMARRSPISMLVFPPSLVPRNYLIRLTVMETPRRAKLSCLLSVKLFKPVKSPTRRWCRL